MALKTTDKANPTSATQNDPDKKLVRTGIKTVATATGQDDPDRMEVINTVQGRLRSRFSDAREAAMRKVRKTNNTVGEETVQEGWFTRNKKEDAKVDQFAAMHHVLKKHGYEYQEKATTKMGHHRTDKKHTHSDGSYVRVFPNHLKDGTMSGPQAVTSHGTRHTDHRDLERHLISKHGVKEEMEPLDEISKELAGRYIKKAKNSRAKAERKIYADADNPIPGHNLPDHERKKLEHTYDKRDRGIDLAKSKKTGREYYDNSGPVWPVKKLKAKIRATGKLNKEDYEMSENMEAMIDAMSSNEPGEFKSAMSAELQSRIVDALDVRRQEIAQSMFNAPEPEEQDTPED